MDRDDELNDLGEDWLTGRLPVSHIAVVNTKEIEKCVRNTNHVGPEPLDV